MKAETENKLIAEFMGIKTKVYSDTPTITYFNFNGTMLTADKMKYSTSWDWLMPVVEKIEGLGFQFFISNDSAYITRWHFAGSFHTISNLLDSKNESVYKTAIRFIQWYNNNTPINLD